MLRQHIIVQRSANSVAQVKGRTISKYGVVFDSDSMPLKVRNANGKSITMVEQISRASLDGADMADMVATFNHNFDKILARTSNNTMSVSIDDTGVKYTIEVGRTSYGDDTLENIKRGDVQGSSFIFIYDPADGYHIERRSDGVLVGSPKNILKIVEMGPVTNPAYPGTNQRDQQQGVHPLIEAAERFLAHEDAELRTAEKTQTVSRAMDVMRVVELVSSAFYKAFEGDGLYYYVRSVGVDNTLVVKEHPSKKLYKLGFSIEGTEVTFDERETWIEVEQEFIPVSAARSFFEALKPEPVQEVETRTEDDTLKVDFVEDQEERRSKLSDRELLALKLRTKKFKF